MLVSSREEAVFFDDRRLAAQTRSDSTPQAAVYKPEATVRPLDFSRGSLLV